jgi:hypothetical protein
MSYKLKAYNIFDLREMAKKRVPRGPFEFMDRGTKECRDSASIVTGFTPRHARNRARIRDWSGRIPARSDRDICARSRSRFRSV